MSPRTRRKTCDHTWARDDAYTKQCVHCQKYAPIREGEFE